MRQVAEFPLLPGPSVPGTFLDTLPFQPCRPSGLRHGRHGSSPGPWPWPRWPRWPRWGPAWPAGPIGDSAWDSPFQPFRPCQAFRSHPWDPRYSALRCQTRLAQKCAKRHLEPWSCQSKEPSVEIILLRVSPYHYSYPFLCVSFRFYIKYESSRGSGVNTEHFASNFTNPTWRSSDMSNLRTEETGAHMNQLHFLSSSKEYRKAASQYPLISFGSVNNASY